MIEEEDVVIVDESTTGEGSGEQSAVIEKVSDTPEIDPVELEEEETEVITSFGDEVPVVEEPVQDSSVIKGIRAKNRQLEKEIKALKSIKSTEKPPVVLGDKPTLASCDYVESDFESKLDEWKETKREVARLETEKTTAEESATKDWNLKLEGYKEGQAKLKVKNFVDIEENVKESLSITQQGLIIQGSDNPALLVYALGNNNKKLEELKKIKDPVKFTFAVAKLEAQLKVTNRTTKPGPEKRVKGSGGTASAVDNVKARLVKEARKTGNFTEVHKYNKQKSKK